MVTIHTRLSTVGKINAEKKIWCFVHYMIRPIRPSFINTVLKARATKHCWQCCKTNCCTILSAWTRNTLQNGTETNYTRMPKGCQKQHVHKLVGDIYVINATLLTQIKPEYLELGTHSHAVWLHIVTNKAVKLHVLSQTKKAARVLRIVTSYREVVPYSVKRYSIVPILFGSSNETEHPLSALLKSDFKNDCDFRNLILELSHQTCGPSSSQCVCKCGICKTFS